MVGALERSGCRIIHRPPPDRAPFVLTFETPSGERAGVVAYAFLANSEKVKNRPDDEHRFQIKYGGDLSGVHRVWQDPHGIYTTLLVGINPAEGFFVAADPVLHDPTRFSVSVEFKDEHTGEIQRRGWSAWERERRGGTANPHAKRSAKAGGDESDPLFEVLVGGRSEQFLRLIQQEQESLGETPGERHLIADQLGLGKLVPMRGALDLHAQPSAARVHALAAEFQLSEARVLDLIAERRMLKMAVRGSVAEEHLLSQLKSVAGVDVCTPPARRWRPRCRGVVQGQARVHALTEKWEFRYAASNTLDPHRHCPGKLDNNVKLDQRWSADPIFALERAAGAA